MKFRLNFKYIYLEDMLTIINQKLSSFFCPFQIYIYR